MARRTKPRKTASHGALENLHNELAKVLAAGLSQKDENGKLNSALLNVARQFLKDNGIEVGAAPAGSPMGDLARLPVFEDDNYSHSDVSH